jgi:RND superfamily putative drug exporter
MPTVVDVLTAAFRPWRRARTWWATADLFLNLLVGTIAFSIVVTLLATSAGLLVTFIVFGLSMDYEVFLLSAVRESYDRTHDNGHAVARGLASTARVITAAATIMVFVFGSFVLSDVRALKLIGLGLAVAVAVDATVVRVVLVPATMELLGDANWWLPRWLRRILPKVDINGHQPPAVPAPEREPALTSSR